MNELTVAIEARPARPDPAKQLACAVIFAALEDLAIEGTDRQLEARRFLFSSARDYREARAHWFRLAQIPVDCIARFKSFDGPTMKQHLGRVLSERKSRRAA